MIRTSTDKCPCIDSSLASLCLTSLNCSAPTYLSDLLQLYTPSLQLRSSADTRVFRIPSFRTKSNGQRSFSYQAPTTWNKLPASIRHASSVSSFRSFFSPLALRCLCESSYVHVCVCVCVCVYACVCMCVRGRACMWFNACVSLTQNNAARLIYRSSKFSHVTPLLHTLHWLSI